MPHLTPRPQSAAIASNDRLRASEARDRVLAEMAKLPGASFCSVDLYRRFVAQERAISLRTIDRALACLESLGTIERVDEGASIGHRRRWRVKSR